MAPSQKRKYEFEAGDHTSGARNKSIGESTEDLKGIVHPASNGVLVGWRFEIKIHYDLPQDNDLVDNIFNRERGLR